MKYQIKKRSDKNRRLFGLVMVVMFSFALLFGVIKTQWKSIAQVLALTSVSLNSGTTTLSTYSDLTSQVTGLGAPAAAYEWSIGAGKLMALNIPFNPGGTQNDYSGNSNNGTNTNGPVFQTAGSGNCQVGGCMSFDGADDYIDTGSNVGNFTVSDEFSIVAWINPALDGNENPIYGNSWSSPGYIFRVNTANKIRWGLATSGTDYIAVDSSVLTAGWHHVVAIWDGSDVSVFVDGADDSQTPLSGGTLSSITTANTTLIGAMNYDSQNHYFNGIIDEVQIYPHALSSGEITQLYNDGNAGNAGPTIIADDDTTIGEVWDLNVTPFDSDGTALSLEASGNTVTIVAPSLTVGLNSGTTTLSTYTDLASQVANLGDPAAAYQWTVDAGNLMALNIPFNSGGTQNDYSGNSNNGTNTNGPVFYTAGSGNCKVGGCMSFDGIDDYVIMPDDATLDITDNLTLSFWLKSSAGGIIVIKGHTAMFYHYSVRALGLKIRYQWYRSTVPNTDNLYLTDADVLSAGTWAHVVVTHASGNKPTIYIDGAEEAATMTVGSASNPLQPNNESFYVALNNRPTPQYSDIDLDELQIYNRVLGSAEVSQLYNESNAGNAGPTIIVSDETLTGQVWDLDVTPFDSDGTALSLAASGNTVTISSPTVTVGLNSGTTTLSSYTDLASQVTGLGTPAAVYQWTVDAANLMALNIPFNYGATQTDYSGNGNNGTKIDSPVFNATGSGNCKVGGCMSFDGVDDVLSLGDNPTSLQPGLGNFTVSSFFKTSNSTQVQYIYFHYIDSPGNATVYVQVQASGEVGGIYRDTDADNVTCTSTNVFNDGNWHHVAWVRTTQVSAALYVDGVIQCSDSNGSLDSITGTASGLNFNAYIGARHWTVYNTFFDGNIDEFQIYPRALSVAQITQLYNDGNAGNAGPTTIVDDETLIGEIWDLDVTPFDSDGTTLPLAASGNTVTIAAPSVTVGLNSGTTSLDPSSDLTSQVAGLGAPAAGYEWSIGANKLMALNIPFNSGSTQTDYSGQGNDGASINGPIFHNVGYENCQVGGCMEFDGSNDYINIPSIAGMNVGTGDISFSAWIKSSSTATEQLIINRQGAQYYGMRMGNTVTAGKIGCGVGGAMQFSSSTYNDDNWHHVVCVRSAGTMTVYVDDSSVASGSNSNDIDGNVAALTISSSGGSALFFEGFIDEVQIYGRALSSTEITQLYNDGGNGEAGPTTIKSDETSFGDIWDLDVTPFDTDGAPLSLVASGNTVVIDNAPTAPTTLYSSDSDAQAGLTNPVGVLAERPVFSAVYNDPDVSDTANQYRIEVADNANLTAPVWDSGALGTAMASCNQGTRCADIVYGAVSALILDETQYYWRIKFWDVSGVESDWSENTPVTNTFTMGLGGGSYQGGQQQQQEEPPPEEITAPAAPGIGGVEVLGPNEIRYNWIDLSSDEDGFRLLNDVGGIIIDNISAGTTSATEGSLAHNTQTDIRKVAAFNSAGQSPPSEAYPQAITAMPNVAASVFFMGDTGIRVGIEETLNNLAIGESGVEFELILFETTLNSAALISSGWVQQEVYVFSDVDLSRGGEVRARARNQVGLISEWSQFSGFEEMIPIEEIIEEEEEQVEEIEEIEEELPVELPTEEETSIIEELITEFYEEEVAEILGEAISPAPPEEGEAESETQTISSYDGESFTIEVIKEKEGEIEEELTITGFASPGEEIIEFTGSTSEPNSVVTLIFNGNVTIVIVSDASGYWATYVSAEQLGIEPGEEAIVSIEAIAAKGSLRSDRVTVGSVRISRASEGEIEANFLTVVSESAVVTAVNEVVQEVAIVIEEQEEEIQTTLTVVAPVVIVSSAPLWGYLPYLPTLIYHFFTYLIGFIGRRKQKGERMFGVAYDSITKEPLGLAIIRVYRSMSAEKLIATKVTDKHGRYDLLLEPGKYRIEVKKPGYTFPSGIVTTSVDGDYDNVYSVETQNLASLEDGQVIIPDVPLDPENAQKTFEIAGVIKKAWLTLQKAGSHIAVPILIVGSLISVAVVMTIPENPTNWILAALYILMLILQLKLRPKISKAWGVVYDVATNAVLPLTTMQLIEPEFGKVVKSRLSDYQGRFNFMPEPGRYVIKANKEGYEQTEVVEGQKDRKPIRGEVNIEKPDQAITGDVAMRVMNSSQNSAP